MTINAPTSQPAASGLLERLGRPESVHRVTSPEAYRAKAQQWLRRAGRPGVLAEQHEQPPAYVSDGRWVIDCVCGNGCIASPEWGLAICFLCGAEWRPVFPSDWQAAEAVLLARPHPNQRHWFPDPALAARRTGLLRAETRADLVAENRAAGIREGGRR